MPHDEERPTTQTSAPVAPPDTTTDEPERQPPREASQDDGEAPIPLFGEDPGV